MPKKVVIFAKILLIFIFPLFLMLTNLYPLLSLSFIKYEYSRDDFPKSEVFNDEERVSIAKAIILYLRTNEDIASLRDINDDYPVFKEKELSHLIDVNILIDKMFLAQKFFGLLMIVLISLLLKEKTIRKKVFFYVILGCLVTILIVGLLTVSIHLNFNYFFINFHRIFFMNESWVFGPLDTLIQLFPEKFWFDALQALMLLTVIEALLLSIVCLGGFYLSGEEKT